jgi:4a-hydroxytetrahydrobiopterin dehydratase
MPDIGCGMVDSLTPRAFYESSGVDEWRVLANIASTCFRSESFARGVELVRIIGALADAADHHPDVDLRYSTVTVRLATHEIQGLSQRDVDLAREISRAARELGVLAQPAVGEAIHVAIDAMDVPSVRAFWRAALNYKDLMDNQLVDPLAIGPTFWFQQMDAPRPERNCVHLDICVPHDQAETRVGAALAAGGRLVTDRFAPSWWVLADPEGNEACVATWRERE